MTPAEFRAIRTRLKLTQTQLGSRLGVTKTTIYLWESGRQRIREAYALAVRGMKGVPSK